MNSPRLILLTGQSDANSCALSPAQREFLRAAAPAGMKTTEIGFPFDPSRAGVYIAPPLWRASLANAQHYLRARYDTAYARGAAQALQNLVDAARSVLVILTGSCGLSIFVAAAPHLRFPPDLRIGVLAFGPVGEAPRTPIYRAVQGRGDVWSRALYRGPPPDLIDGGHLDYWTSPEARDIARTFACECARG